MTPEDFKGLSQEDKFKLAGQFAGADVFKGIYQTESSGGKHLVSPAGALGPFQFMPATTATWSKRLGRTLDPMDFDDALYMAASQIKENMRSTNDVGDALRMYNAGTDRQRWNNPETRAYVGKVSKAQGMDFGSDEQAFAAAPAETNPNLVTLDPLDIVYGHKAMSSEVRDAKPLAPKQSQQQIDMAAMGPLQTPQIDLDQGAATRLAAEQAAEQVEAPIGVIGKNRFGVEIKEGSFLAKAAAAVDTTLTSSFAKSFDRLMSGPADPEFKDWKYNNITEISKMADSPEMFNDLLNAGNRKEFDLRISQKEKSEALQRGARWKGGAEQTAFALAAGVGADPVGAFAGLLTDGAANAAGFGGHALIASGKVGRGFAAHATTGSLGNIGATALLQASGEHVSVNDYMMAGTTGGLLGVTGGFADLVTTSKVRNALSESQWSALTEAHLELGQDADAAAVVSRANDKLTAQATSTYDAALYKESEHTFMPRDTEDVLLETDAQKRKAAVEAGNTNDVDGTVRNVKNEMFKQAQVIDATIKTDDKATFSPLAWLPDAESAGLTLTKSENVMFRAIGKALLEVGSGANGRRNNAAMTKHVLLQRALGDTMGWHDLESEYVAWAKDGGLFADMFNADMARKRFQTEVNYQILHRQRGEVYSQDPMVEKGADIIEQGYTRLADMQRGAGTAGSARLPETSRGYLPRVMDLSAYKRIKADPAAENAVVNAIAEQLSDASKGSPSVRGVKGRTKRGEGSAFDPAFATKVARRYLKHAADKLNGKGNGINIDMNDLQSAQMLRDVLKGMGDGSPEDAAQIDALLGRMSRGGGTWTKARLNLDLTKTISDGKGGTMRLGDIFSHDVYGNYLKQAHRVSGEAALARHNIMGVAGINLLREAAMDHGYTPKELKAFDQVFSEFMNMPIGTHGGKRIGWLDDLTVATGAARLGAAQINQLGEYSVAINTIGIDRTASAVAGFGRYLSEIDTLRKTGKSDNKILRVFDALGVFVGGEDYANSGFFGQFKDNDVEIAGTESLSMFGRIARSGAKAQYILTGHRATVAAQTRGLAEQTLVKAFGYIKEGKNDVNLRDMGMSDDLLKRVRANLDNIATFNEKGQLTELSMDNWDGQDLLDMQVALHRGTGQMIQRTFIGETGPWVHDSVLKALYQFRRVGIIAMEKQNIRDLSNKGVVGMFAGLMTGIALGIPIHAARVEYKSLGMSEDKRKEYLETNLNPMALSVAALNYATKSGMLGDAAQFASGAAATSETAYNKATGGEGKTFNGLYSAISGGSRAGSRPFVGGTIAPAFGTVNDALSGKPDKMLRVLPGASMLAVQPLFNAVGAHMDEGDKK